MAAIYILSGYQNYFNRQIKEPKEMVAAYPSNLVSYWDAGNTTQVLNFNPNDGVITHHIVGRPDKPFDGSGDYFLWTEDGITVTSRWFIIESKRTRQGQYDITLKRDVIADNYQSVLNSDCFIQKATVDDESPLIYNQEPITVNQIKTKETPLIDESKMAWIVGFVDREAKAKTLSINSTVIPDIKVDSLSDWEYYNYIGSTVGYNRGEQLRAYIGKKVSQTGSVISFEKQRAYIASTKVKVESNPDSDVSFPTTIYVYEGTSNNLQSYLLSNKSTLLGYVGNSLNDYFTLPTFNKTDYDNLVELKSKIIQVGSVSTGYTYYRINIETESLSQNTFVTEDKGTSELFTNLNNTFNSYSGYITGQAKYNISVAYGQLKLTLTKVVEGEYTIDFPDKTNHLINKSAPFDIFCIPYSDDMSIQVGSSIISANKQFAMSLASEIGRTLGEYCYDIQLLPYCPMTGYTVTEKLFDINSTDSKRYTAVKKDEETIYWLFWSTSSSGTFNIPYLEYPTNIKLSNQCDMYRLVSPNYSGQFEFNLAKNGGIDYFNVDYTYLPVSSYIHVNPNFMNLYGQDFNDARGLICQGDFSIMYLSDAWVNYQQQNKNFEQIFSREISNMDVNRKYQRMSETISAWTGAIGAGGGIGGLIGGVAGAIGGTIAGGVSLAAGYADRAISDKLYQESVSFKKDVHEMQLENIKALPNSIAKTTAYTENNKIFPILEYYTCTDEERDLVGRAIANMGMTVNAVGKPINYINNDWAWTNGFDKGFFKATLLRIENLPEDYHMLQSIAEELSLGVYFKGD